LAPSETLDHFLCYKAKRAEGEPRFRLDGEVQLADQFNPEETTVDIAKVKQFCTAVSKDGSVIQDSAAHLTCYKMKRPKRKTKIQVISTPDQLDQLELDVRARKRGELCVPSQFVERLVPSPTATPTTTPTATSATATPTATPTAAPITTLDHFEMYRIKRTKGTPEFEPETADLDDRFLNETTTMNLKKPKRLGVPTSKDGGSIDKPLTHLSCYFLGAPRVRIQEVVVTNQFRDNQRLSLRNPYMLCVPSYKQVVTFN
jgi:hypothetical protein